MTDENSRSVRKGFFGAAFKVDPPPRIKWNRVDGGKATPKSTVQETGHFSSCPERKASGLPVTGDQNPPLADTISFVALIMGLPARKNLRLGPVPHSPKSRRLLQVRTRRRKKGYGNSLVGAEERAEQRGLSPIMTPGTITPTAPFPLPTLRAMPRPHTVKRKLQNRK